MTGTTKTLFSAVFLFSLGCATATVNDETGEDDNPTTMLPTGDGDMTTTPVVGDGDGDMTAGTGGAGTGGGGLVGDGDGDAATGGTMMGSGGTMMGSGGMMMMGTGDCATCTEWSSFSYTTGSLPSLGQCVIAADGSSHVYTSGDPTKIECGPPGADRPDWCTDTNSVFTACP